MEIYRSEQQWLKLIEEAECSLYDQRTWCSKNQIKYGTFRMAKVRLKKAGKLPCQKQIALKKENSYCLCWHQDEPAQDIFFFTQPAPSCSLAFLGSAVENLMKQNLASGNWFLFLSKTKKSIYALRWYGYGYDQRKITKEKGTFPWADAGGYLSQNALQMLLKIVL